MGAGRGRGGSRHLEPEVVGVDGEDAAILDDRSEHPVVNLDCVYRPKLNGRYDRS